MLILRLGLLHQGPYVSFLDNNYYTLQLLFPEFLPRRKPIFYCAGRPGIELQHTLIR